MVLGWYLKSLVNPACIYTCIHMFLSNGCMGMAYMISDVHLSIAYLEYACMDRLVYTCIGSKHVFGIAHFVFN